MKRALGRDELIFHFDVLNGVDAQRLGAFLQRAGKVARDNGADMFVIGFEEGSLDVIVKIVKSLGKKIAGGFNSNPITTTGGGIAIARAIADVLAATMDPTQCGATPLAKSGAEIVEKEGVRSITIISNGGNVIVMDPVIAAKIRDAERSSREPRRRLVHSEYEELQQKIAGGSEITGLVVAMDGDLYFRPDGERFAVQIDLQNSAASDIIYPGASFRIRGDLIFRNARPYSLVISSALPS